MSDTSLVLNILAKDKTRATFDKMKAAAVVAGAAIGAALAAGAVAGLEKSKLDGVLAAQLGASPAQAGALGKVSGELYAAGFGQDMPAVTHAIKSAAQNGLVALEKIGDESSKALIGKLMTVSTAMGEESDRVSAAVSTMLRTGMVATAEEAMDLLVAATQRGVNKSQDLVDTAVEYSTLFRSLGLDGAQSMGLLAQAIGAGARNADQVADGLKELGIRAINGSKAARDAYRLLGLDADRMIAQIARGGPEAAAGMDLILDRLRGMRDPVAQNAAGVGLLGDKWEDMRDAVLAMDLDTASGQMDGFTGATERANAAIQETAGQKLENLKRKIQQAIIDKLGQAVPYIEATFGWLSRNSGWVTPLAVGLGVLASAVYGVTFAMKVWAAVQTVLNLALWTSPITWIVAAVLILVAIIVLIATKTTWFQTIWKYTWGAIKAVAKAVWDGIVWAARTWWDTFSGFWTGVGRFFKNLWDDIKGWFGSAWDWIKKTWNKGIDFFQSIPGKLKSGLRTVKDIITKPFKSAFNAVAGFWNRTIGSMSFTAPSWVPGIGGKGFSMPKLPMLAQGGTFTRAGWAVVGERGPELLHAPAAARVTPLPRGAAAGGSQQPTVVELRGDGSDLAELLLHLLRRAIRVRGGNVQVVLGGGRR